MLISYIKKLNIGWGGGVSWIYVARDRDES
jgi:hypothetical protein